MFSFVRDCSFNKLTFVISCTHKKITSLLPYRKLSLNSISFLGLGCLHPLTDIVNLGQCCLPTSLNLSTMLVTSFASTPNAFIVEMIDSLASLTLEIPVLLLFPFIKGRGRSFLPASTVLLLDYSCRPDHIFTLIIRVVSVCLIVTF